MEKNEIRSYRHRLRRARCLESAMRYHKLGRPLKTFYILATVRACDIEYDADTYKYLANADPPEHMFTVLNPATGLPDEVFTACKSSLPDEVFTACVIKRCHEDQCNDLSVAVMAASDDVQGTSVLKHHTEEIGESSKTMVTASGVADEVLAANVQRGGHTLWYSTFALKFALKELILSTCSFLLG
ncbi:hypothetical protein Tco_0015285 [Tanacetum coccineum]